MTFASNPAFDKVEQSAGFSRQVGSRWVQGALAGGLQVSECGHLVFVGGLPVIENSDCQFLVQVNWRGVCRVANCSNSLLGPGVLRGQI